MDDRSEKARKWAFWLTGAVLVSVVAGLLLLLTPLGAAVFYALRDTTITFRNGTDQPCSVTVSIVATDRGRRDSEHRFELPAGGRSSASGSRTLDAAAVRGYDSVLGAVAPSTRQLSWNEEVGGNDF